MKPKNPGIEIVCTLNTAVSAKQAKVFQKALTEAFRKAYPDETIRACWVHERFRRITEG